MVRLFYMRWESIHIYVSVIRFSLNCHGLHHPNLNATVIICFPFLRHWLSVSSWFAEIYRPYSSHIQCMSILTKRNDVCFNEIKGYVHILYWKKSSIMSVLSRILNLQCCFSTLLDIFFLRLFFYVYCTLCAICSQIAALVSLLPLIYYRAS